MAKQRLGIIGCGQIAHTHAAAAARLGDYFHLNAVVDHNLKTAQSFAKQYGAQSYYDDDKALYSKDCVDAVVVASPNVFHKEHVLRALEAGVNVLVEKPIAESIEDAENMQLAAKNSRKVLAVGHTFRHSKAILELLKRRAEFGKLTAIEVRNCVLWDGPKVSWWTDRTPEQGLIIPMFAPHALDFIYLLADAEPVFLNAVGVRHQSGWQAEDEVMIHMTFASRVLASAYLSYNQGRVQDTKTLFFDKGIAVIENGVVLRWNDETLIDESHTIDDPHKMGGRDLSCFFEAQLVEFYKAISGEQNQIASARDGVALMRMLDRTLRSVRKNSSEFIDR